MISVFSEISYLIPPFCDKYFFFFQSCCASSLPEDSCKHADAYQNARFSEVWGKHTTVSITHARDAALVCSGFVTVALLVMRRKSAAIHLPFSHNPPLTGILGFVPFLIFNHVSGELKEREMLSSLSVLLCTCQFQRCRQLPYNDLQAKPMGHKSCATI